MTGLRLGNSLSLCQLRKRSGLCYGGEVCFARYTRVNHVGLKHRQWVKGRVKPCFRTLYARPTEKE